jgi:hypothetical protein
VLYVSDWMDFSTESASNGFKASNIVKLQSTEKFSAHRGIERKQMTYREKHDATVEKRQERLEAGLISDRFPEVESVNITMTDRQKGINPISILRIFNFQPGSYAYFHMGCLNKDCIDGGYDLDHVVATMVRDYKELGEGELSCDESNSRSVYSNIRYKISIQYMMSSNLDGKDLQTVSMLEHMRLVTSILFDHNGTTRNRLSDKSKAELMDSISYLVSCF